MSKTYLLLEGSCHHLQPIQNYVIDLSLTDCIRAYRLLTFSGALGGVGSVFFEEEKRLNQLLLATGAFSSRGPWARSTESLLGLELAESSLTGLTFV